MRVEEDARRLVRRLATAALPASVQGTKVPRVVHFVLLSLLICAGGWAAKLLWVGVTLAAVCLWIAGANLLSGAPIFRARVAWQARTRGAAPEGSPLARLRLFRDRVDAANLPEPARQHFLTEVEGLVQGLEEAFVEAMELQVAGADPAPAQQRLARVESDLTGLEAELAKVAAEVRTF
jgi:hypothetical protein